MTLQWQENCCIIHISATKFVVCHHGIHSWQYYPPITTIYKTGGNKTYLLQYFYVVAMWPMSICRFSNSELPIKRKPTLSRAGPKKPRSPLSYEKSDAVVKASVDVDASVWQSSFDNLKKRHLLWRLLKCRNPNLNC
jgi:hypothetical protein